MVARESVSETRERGAAALPNARRVPCARRRSPQATRAIRANNARGMCLQSASERFGCDLVLPDVAAAGLAGWVASRRGGGAARGWEGTGGGWLGSATLTHPSLMMHSGRHAKPVEMPCC